MDCDGSPVVIRFTPLAADKLRTNAEGTFADDTERRHTPARYGVSVLADGCRPGESIADVVARVCSDTRLGGKTIAVATGAELKKIGYDVVADPTDTELQHHLVGEDPFTALPDFEPLASLLEGRRMRNPAYGRGVAA